MQHALPRPQTQKVTAVMAALAIAGMGGIAIANSGDDDVSRPSAPTLSGSPTGADRPTPAAGRRPGLSQPSPGHVPQRPGGARP
jgi:hypothetical protein